MVNSAVAYVLAVLTAFVLLIAGVSLAVSTGDVVEADATETADSTTTPVAEVTTIVPATTAAPVPVVVPPLGGLTASDARNLLRGLGLTVTTSFTDVSVGYAIGLVVAANPPEGIAMLPGETIDISVGQRPKPVTVPRATPNPWAEAEAVDVVDRTIGRCSVARLDGTLVTLDGADCAGPHDFQFLASVSAVDSYPSREDAGRALDALCDEQFATFVGAPPSGSMLFTSLVMDWSADRSGAEGDCLISRPFDVQLVGDAFGSLW